MKCMAFRETFRRWFGSLELGEEPETDDVGSKVAEEVAH